MRRCATALQRTSEQRLLHLRHSPLFLGSGAEERSTRLKILNPVLEKDNKMTFDVNRLAMKLFVARFANSSLPEGHEKAQATLHAEEALIAAKAFIALVQARTPPEPRLTNPFVKRPDPSAA